MFVLATRSIAGLSIVAQRRIPKSLCATIERSLSCTLPSSAGSCLHPSCLHDRPVVAAAPDGRSLEGAFALETGLLVERGVKLFLALAKGLAAAAHHCPGRLEQLVESETRRTRPYETAVNDGTCLGSRMPAGKTLHMTPIAVPVLSMLPMPVRV